MLSRVIVLGALVLTRHVATALHVSPTPVQTRDGLVSWDAGWYWRIAAGGYDSIPKEGLRFFPLVPLLARAGGWLPGISVRLSLLLVVNASALAAGFLVYELVRREQRPHAVASRAVWIMYLAPPAFVLVMGYAEALMMTAALVALLALRGGRWWIAAAAGIVAGMTRPVGLLLVVPALVEVYRTRHGTTARDFYGRAATVLGPVAGAGAYLVWAERRTGDLLYPIRVQQASARRGGWIDPVRAVWRAARDLGSGDHLSAGIHLVTAAALVALVVTLWRHWPASFTAYAIAAVVLGLSAHNLDSLERYSLSTVPLTFAAAELVGRGTREQIALVALGATLVAFSVLAFSGVLVP